MRSEDVTEVSNDLVANAPNAVDETGGETTHRVPRKVIWGYALGTVGFEFVLLMTSRFINLFFTNVLGLGLSTVAVIMLVGRIWDGVNDPIMGALVDRNDDPRGRYRPYLLWGIAPLAVTVVLLYTNPGLSGWLLTAYAGVVYVAFGMAYTFVNVPYMAMMATITDDPNERTRLVTIRSIMTVFAGMTPAFLVPAIAISDEGVSAQGFLIVAIIGAGLLTGLSLVAYRSTSTVKYTQAPDSAITWKERVDAVLGNGPLILVSLTWFVIAVLEVVEGSVTYYVLNVLGQGDRVVQFTAVAAIGALLSFGMVPIAIKFEKKTAILIALPLYIVASIVWYFIPEDRIGLMLIPSGMRMMGIGLGAVLIWTLIADCVDYSTFRTGKHQGGIVSSTATLMKKTAGGVGAVVLNLSLAAVGFAPLAASQTPEAAAGVKSVMTLVSAGIALIGFVLMLFYPLSKSRMAEIKEAIDHAGA